MIERRRLSEARTTRATATTPATLVHVCDVYDALRTNRPYRDAWESERVLAYLEERAGKEFDPKTARSFIEMVRGWDERVATAEGKLARESETT